MAVSLLSIYAIFLVTRENFATSPVVQTPWGKIVGSQIQDDQGNSLDAYVGIPFAMPPIGDLRFKKPVPHAGTSTTFNATTPGSACIQVVLGGGPNKMYGEEDCLTLNVYVPIENKTSSPRAVMVWIYGGAFLIGDANLYNPTPLATVGNVISVSIQYRLGPFGFLSTMDNAAKGNYGLWDQLLALKWIKKNIGAFGGDPDQITIIGESAGAASVGFLTVSPEGIGLFKRAILQSGSVTSSWAITRDPLPTTYRLAGKTGCGNLKNDHVSLIFCMRAVPAKTLVAASWPSTNDLGALMADVPYAPVVDGEYIPVDPQILLSSPRRLMSSAFYKCDVMLGVNNNEGGDMYGGATFYDKILNTSLGESLKKSNFYKTKLLPVFIGDFYGEHNADMVETAAFEYMFPNSVSSENIDLQSVFNTKTDAAFLAPAIWFARAHASLHGTGKTYLYYFDHYPNMTFFPDDALTPGMHHGFDICYTFGFSDSIKKTAGCVMNITAAEINLSVTFRSFLTQFAKFGDPSGAVKKFLSETWPEFDTSSEKYLDFNDHMTVRNHVASRRVSLWLELLPKLRYGNKLTPTRSGGSV